MMTSQISKFPDLWKTYKSKYLENEAQFFAVLKKSLVAPEGLYYDKKNNSLEQVTFK